MTITIYILNTSDLESFHFLSLSEHSLDIAGGGPPLILQGPGTRAQMVAPTRNV